MRLCAGRHLKRCPRFALALFCLSFSLFVEVGEAANPGPSSSSFVLGAFNPSGLKGKAPFIVSHLAQGDIWAVSETHLCSQSMAAFRSSMHFAQGPFRFCVGGHPVPASSDRAFHAAWRGVAVLSKHPTRHVPSHVPIEVLRSSRICPYNHFGQ